MLVYFESFLIFLGDMQVYLYFSVVNKLFYYEREVDIKIKMMYHLYITDVSKHI